MPEADGWERLGGVYRPSLAAAAADLGLSEEELAAALARTLVDGPGGGGGLETESEGRRSDEHLLRLFCEQVAGLGRFDETAQHAGKLFALRQFVSMRSPTYFYRVADALDRSLIDGRLAVSNRENRERWRRLLSIRSMGSERSRIPRLIVLLDNQRLLIDKAFARQALVFTIGGGSESKASQR